MKDAVLKSLKQTRVVSGQALASELGISRTAVWKYVNQLRREGYRISSSPRLGYRLDSVPDSLLAAEIEENLHTRIQGRKIISCRQMQSTQDHAKKLAIQGSSEGTIVVAETQSAGRGRLGRSWASPPGGLYFSVILRPGITLAGAAGMPLVAAVALARAIQRYTTVAPGLKWPNDVLIKKRKAAGILVEMSAEMDRLDWVVIGIGVNVAAASVQLPPEIRPTSTSLAVESARTVHRVQLLGDILYELEGALDMFQTQGFEPLRKQWKEKSHTLGKHVTVVGSRQSIEGKAVDIDGSGALIMECVGGIRERVTSGDLFFKGGAHG
jgi:BirA family biotin operon repressor/biotin-[acetyl-CoA-carboxylase] ligase